MSEATTKKKVTAKPTTDKSTVSANLKGIEPQFEELRKQVIKKAPWASDPSNSDVVRFAIITAAQAIEKGD
jgi:hypothetical protein